MASKYWLGTAGAVAQESRATPANVEIGDVFSLLINGEVIATFTATVATVANVTAGLTAAWAAAVVALNPYALRITASNQATYVKLLANNAGEPFTVTALATNGGAANTQTLTMSTPTVSAGPNDWSTAANWSDGAVPANGDTVVLKDSDVSIIWGLDQSAVTLAKLLIFQSYEGFIGNNRNLLTAADGSTEVDTRPEYRGEYLKISATVYDHGQNFSPGTPNGSTRVKIDLGANASTVTIYNTALTADRQGLPAIRLLCNHVTTIVYVRKAPGGIGIAVDRPNETSSLDKVSVSDTSTSSRVFIGAGTTIVTFEQNGGDNILSAAATVTTVNVKGGNLLIEGDFTITTFNNTGGSVVDNHTKTAGNAITTLNLDGGSQDGQQSTQPRTWATVNFQSGTYKIDGAIVTITTLVDRTSGKFTSTVTPD